MQSSGIQINIKWIKINKIKFRSLKTIDILTEYNKKEK
jgi:hypothetical protein